MKHTADKSVVDLNCIEKEFHRADKIVKDLGKKVNCPLTNINVLLGNRDVKQGTSLAGYDGNHVIVTYKQLKGFYWTSFSYPYTQLFKRILKT